MRFSSSATAVCTLRMENAEKFIDRAGKSFQSIISDKEDSIMSDHKDTMRQKIFKKN